MLKDAKTPESKLNVHIRLIAFSCYLPHLYFGILCCNSCLHLSATFLSLPFPASSPLSSSWSADGRYCRVVKESGNYVECACSHLSIYTAYAEFATLASYNEAFYVSGFICISGTKHALCLLFFICHLFSCVYLCLPSAYLLFSPAFSLVCSFLRV